MGLGGGVRACKVSGFRAQGFRLVGPRGSGSRGEFRSSGSWWVEECWGFMGWGLGVVRAA